MRVIWVAGRTRTPIIGSLQKSRENPGSILKSLTQKKGIDILFFYKRAACLHSSSVNWFGFELFD